MGTGTDLVYRGKKLAVLYELNELATAIASLERPLLIHDATANLARAVNTSVSQRQPVSRWVRYREAYSPELVRFLIKQFPVAPSNAYILDPMCGSGSTQLAAQSLGYASMGTDVNPYAVLVSKVKTTAMEMQKRRTIGAVLDEQFRFSLHRGRLSESDQYLARYFPRENFQQLLALRNWLNATFESDPTIYDFAMVALLAIVEACSNRRKDGNGLATRPAPISHVTQAFEQQIRMMLEDLPPDKENRPLAANHLISALEIESAVDIANRTFKQEIGAIIFSPPYANSFDYFESYKLELLFGGFYTPAELQAARTNLIRNFRQSGRAVPSDHHLVELLIEEILRRIPRKERLTGSVDGRARLLPNMLRGYFSDMNRFLNRASRVMPPGSRMHIVVDQSAYLGVPIPTDLLLVELAERNGLSLERITICRPAKTSGQQLALQPMLADSLRESIVSLSKVGN